MGDSDERVIFWFRRDLRLADNPALVAAASSGPVLGLFVLDPALWRVSGDPRRAFLVDCLVALDHATGGRLVVRHGDPVDVVPEVAGELAGAEVYATADYGPYGRRRDDRVADALPATGGRAHFVDSPYAVPPDTVKTGSGATYKVFTPFYRSWKQHGWVDPVGRPGVEWLEARSDGVPDRPDVGAELPPGGEEAANARLDEFLDGPVGRYHDDRDRPGVDGTSRLSAQLKFGTLHPRQLLARLGRSRGEEAFRSELAWREFYADVLYDRPDSARTAYDEKLAAMELDSGRRADERFEAWCRGRTGYPIVDAGMRQLLATGWMHNRLRMISASFLVKDLHIDWTRGARWFMAHLVDGDLASNNHGWQWVAGTGTYASPYFRIFNPVSQGRRFDPDGGYIKRWVPGLADRSGRALHEPWTDEAGPPNGYPWPIVDHARERAESLARYRHVSNRDRGVTPPLATLVCRGERTDAMLDERKAAILKAVIEEYIETAQPVGSTRIVASANVKVSSATVRNDMAVLEAEGYLTQPHTSAGRVPTEKGYRYFVDHLGQAELSGGDRRRVVDFFAHLRGEIEGMMRETARLLTSMTNYAAVVVDGSEDAADVRSVQLVGLSERVALAVIVLSNGQLTKHTIELPTPIGDAVLSEANVLLRAAFEGRSLSDPRVVPASGSAEAVGVARVVHAAVTSSTRDTGRVYVDGASRVVGAFEAVESVSRVLTILEQQLLVVSLLADVVDRGLTVAIGSETGVAPLAECSLVVSPYEIDGEHAGSIAVLGPTRMNYQQALSAVAAVSHQLGTRLSEG